MICVPFFSSRGLVTVQCMDLGPGSAYEKCMCGNLHWSPHTHITAGGCGEPCSNAY